jgi:hypothetical protein
MMKDQEEIQSGVKSNDETSLDVSKEENTYLRYWATEMLPLIKT